MKISRFKMAYYKFIDFINSPWTKKPEYKETIEPTVSEKNHLTFHTTINGKPILSGYDSVVFNYTQSRNPAYKDILFHRNGKFDRVVSVFGDIALIEKAGSYCSSGFVREKEYYTHPVNQIYFNKEIDNWHETFRNDYNYSKYSFHPEVVYAETHKTPEYKFVASKSKKSSKKVKKVKKSTKKRK